MDFIGPLVVARPALIGGRAEFAGLSLVRSSAPASAAHWSPVLWVGRGALSVSSNNEFSVKMFFVIADNTPFGENIVHLVWRPRVGSVEVFNDNYPQGGGGGKEDPF